MGHYKSNVRDLEFMLFEVLQRDEILGSGPYEEVDADVSREILAEVAAEVAADAVGVRAIAVSHRGGALEIGDAALVAAVAADHRAAAFQTCARLVDVVKERLPVWKHQFFADGSDEWVNSA